MADLTVAFAAILVNYPSNSKSSPYHFHDNSPYCCLVHFTRKLSNNSPIQPVEFVRLFGMNSGSQVRGPRQGMGGHFLCWSYDMHDWTLNWPEFQILSILLFFTVVLVRFHFLFTIHFEELFQFIIITSPPHPNPLIISL